MRGNREREVMRPNVVLDIVFACDKCGKEWVYAQPADGGVHLYPDFAPEGWILYFAGHKTHAQYACGDCCNGLPRAKATPSSVFTESQEVTMFVRDSERRAELEATQRENG